MDLWNDHADHDKAARLLPGTQLPFPRTPDMRLRSPEMIDIQYACEKLGWPKSHGSQMSRGGVRKDFVQAG